MVVSPTVVYRVIDGRSHVLNYTTGGIMSFEVGEEDIRSLIKSWSDRGTDIDDEVRKFFSESGEMPNSRLCRENLIELGMHFSFPTVANLELNKRCSLRCVHCYIESDDLKSPTPSFFEDMTETQIENFLYSLRRMGVFLLVLTGGEPFPNRNMERLIRKASAMGFILEIFSNLQLIPEWFLRSNPSTFKVGRIQTSVYSANPTIHDEITTVGGSFERTIRNIRFLKRKGYYVEVATPLMRANFETRNETAALFRSLGIRQDFSWPIVNEYRSSVHGKASLNIFGDQAERFAAERPDFFIQLDTKHCNEPVCAAGRALFGIMCNGDVWPCSQYPLVVGNVQEDDIRDILESPVMLEIAGRARKILKGRRVFNFCMGTNYAETGDPFQQPGFMVESTPAFGKKKGGEKR